MAWVIVVALIGLPVLEIALFIKSAQWIGILPTILLAIAAGMAGIALVRRQGFETMFRARAQLDRGEFPIAEAFDGLCIGVAGALLFLPGFFSDVLALALLLPPVRAGLRLWLASRMRGAVVATQSQGQAQPPGQRERPPVIEGDYRVVDDKDSRDDRQ